jgi:GNAT superfamily N-acetyltransferase
MADLLIKLYDLPAFGSVADERPEERHTVRPAAAYEKLQILAFVGSHFGAGWASECDVAFANRPISCHIATQGGEILGFACYDSTRRGFFGPIGVAEAARGQGIGRRLLLSCLGTMETLGYAYAIVGAAGCPRFYLDVAGAIEIPGSTPGIYLDRLKGM